MLCIRLVADTPVLLNIHAVKCCEKKDKHVWICNSAKLFMIFALTDAA